MSREIYADRKAAGQILADEIKRGLEGSKTRPLILAIPRGGVIIGSIVAKALDGELDLVIPRKLGARLEPEFALGAVMHDGTAFLSQEAITATESSPDYIEAETERQVAEAKRRLAEYRGERPEPTIAGRTVVVVDDGVATGATMIVALRWVRPKRPRFLVVATPLAPRPTLELLEEEADMVICPNTPEPFYSIGGFYGKFEQVADDQVKAALRESWNPS